MVSFPGFVSLYTDSFGKSHIYFFKGLTENFKPIYKSLDLSNIKQPYKFTEYPDKAIDYVFEGRIDKVECNLVEVATGKVTVITINNARSV